MLIKTYSKVFLIIILTYLSIYYSIYNSYRSGLETIKEFSIVLYS